MRDSIPRERINWDDEIEDRQFFANRSFEVGLVEQKVNEAQSKAVVHPVTEFHAVTGQGKSWLLRHFYLKFRRTSGQWSPKRILVARVTFDDLSKESWFQQAAEVLEKLARQFSKQIPKPIELPKPPGGRIPSPRELARQSRVLVDALGKLTDRHVPILIFDGAEDADDDLFDWLEEILFYPLVSRQQTLFIVGSKRELYWKLYDVRRRVDSQLLPPFTEVNADEQMRKRASGETAGELLFPYSAGHPETNLEIVEALRAERDIAEITVEELTSNQDLIRRTIANVIEGRFLSGLKGETRQFVWDICILRKFHTEYVRFMAARRNEQYLEKGEGFFLDAIREMIDKALVEWDSERGGYVLDPTVRQIMIKNLEMDNLAEFGARQQRAVAFYKLWMEKVPANTPGYLVELLYHQEVLLRLGQTSEPAILEEFTGGMNYCSPENLPYLLTRFNQDEDLKGLPESLLKEIQTKITEKIPLEHQILPTSS